MIPTSHLSVLRKLYAHLHDSGINWVITGSTSFALQGVVVTPHDIDIQTDEAGAYAAARLFDDCVTRPVAFRSSERIRSHFGALEIDGVQVEIMGDIEKRLSDGTWEPPPDLKRHQRIVVFGGMRLPVLSLEYEYDAYLKLGRIERVQMLKDVIDRRS